MSGSSDPEYSQQQVTYDSTYPQQQDTYDSTYLQQQDMCDSTNLQQQDTYDSTYPRQQDTYDSTYPQQQDTYDATVSQDAYDATYSSGTYDNFSNMDYTGSSYAGESVASNEYAHNFQRSEPESETRNVPLSSGFMQPQHSDSTQNEDPRTYESSASFQPPSFPNATGGEDLSTTESSVAQASISPPATPATISDPAKSMATDAKDGEKADSAEKRPGFFSRVGSAIRSRLSTSKSTQLDNFSNFVYNDKYKAWIPDDEDPDEWAKENLPDLAPPPTSSKVAAGNEADGSVAIDGQSQAYPQTPAPNFRAPPARSGRRTAPRSRYVDTFGNSQDEPVKATSKPSCAAPPTMKIFTPQAMPGSDAVPSYQAPVRVPSPEPPEEEEAGKATAASTKTLSLS